MTGKPFEPKTDDPDAGAMMAARVAVLNASRRINAMLRHNKVADVQTAMADTGALVWRWVPVAQAALAREGVYNADLNAVATWIDGRMSELFAKDVAEFGAVTSPAPDNERLVHEGGSRPAPKAARRTSEATSA